MTTLVLPGMNSATGRIGIGVDVKPHAYDPAANPELFDGVLARRFVAFVIDVIILAIPLIVAWVFIFVFGIVTLGLGWALYWADVADLGGVGAVLLRLRRSAARHSRHDRHARHGNRNAHLVRRAEPISCSARFMPSSTGSASAC